MRSARCKRRMSDATVDSLARILSGAQAVDGRLLDGCVRALRAAGKTAIAGAALGDGPTAPLLVEGVVVCETVGGPERAEAHADRYARHAEVRGVILIASRLADIGHAPASAHGKPVRIVLVR